MRATEASGSAYRFGSFELNPLEGELRKHGVHIKLQDQPLQILILLVQHPGNVVTREEIQNRLWPPGTHVDYDNAINSAVRKLRDALGDSSENPRFIETLARRGYRFVGQIETPRTEKPLESITTGQVPTKSRVDSKRKSKFVLLACAAFLVIATAAGWWLLRAHSLGEPTQLTAVPLTAATGWENGASFSPDGNQMAYLWNRSENGTGYDQHIYVKSIGAGKPLQLTADARPDGFPAWSPDGSMIAFFRYRDLTTDIYLVPPLGGAERKVAEGYFGIISWSPDSRYLAASESGSPPLGSSSLYLVAVENGNKMRLTTPPDPKTQDMDPVFSPDGRLLLFTRCAATDRCGLYLLDLAADYRPVGGPRLLREHLGDIAGAAWTTDGREVLYSLSTDGKGTYHLMKVRVGTGAQVQRLEFAVAQAWWPAIARRGNRLAYTEGLHNIDIWQIRPGEPPRSFASSTRDDFNPQYSPDGKRVAFSSNRSGVMQIWVCDQDGGNPTQLTRFETGPSGTPRWSPDGRWIAFDRQLRNGYRIFVMAADGGQVRRLTPEEGESDEYIPSWSRHGNWIYYGCNRTGRDEVWKAPAQGGQGTQVTHNGGFVAFESSDGQSLYYTKSDDNPGIWVQPRAGGQERLIVESIISRSFAVMDEGIYYFVPNNKPDGSASLRLHSFATGKNVEIAPINQQIDTGMTVSPNRKTILFSTLVRSGSNLMVVDNFR
jgi:Tol biopolymer transport system component/DNA-binding winged helix-turn-helix (wHTH) protein